MKKITKLFVMAVLLTVSVSAFAQPTSSATTPPTRSGANVISIFSDAYTNVSGTNFFPSWGQATTYTPVTIGTDNVIKYSNLNYEGIEFGSHVNALNMTYLHIDVWTADETSFQIYPIMNGNAFEKFVTKTPTLNSWNSYDIPLTDFTSQGLILSDLIQFKFVGAGGHTVYLDNIYFYTAESSLTLSSAGISVAAAASSTNTFDITTALSWTASSNQSWLTLSNESGTGNSTITVTAAANTTYSDRSATVTVTASDNVEKTITVTQAAFIPAAAPTPNMSSSNVIALYSDAYTCIPAAYQVWAASSFEEVTLGTGANKAEKANSTNCFGIALGASTDVSSMTKLHVDIFPTTLPSMILGLVAPAGKEAKLPVTLTAGQWNSVDLNLSDLMATNAECSLSTVMQVGFWGLSGAFYIDNALFYNGSYTTTGINNIVAENGIKCYPSIATDKLTVRANSEIAEISIVSLLGQTVKTQLVKAISNTIDLSSLATGNYFVKVKMENGQVGALKFVKQ